MESKQKKSSEEQKILSDLREMKTELAQISMVDEFARHAKLQRKITRSQDDLKKISKMRPNSSEGLLQIYMFLANSRMLSTTAKKAAATQIVNVLLVRAYFLVKF